LPLLKDGIRLLVALSLRGHDARFSPTQATERQGQHCGRCRPDRQDQLELERNLSMRKINMAEFVFPDGVIETPGGPGEDTSGGFAYGGWIRRVLYSRNRVA